MAASDQAGASETGHRLAAAVVVAGTDGLEALVAGINAEPGGVVKVLCVSTLGAG